MADFGWSYPPGCSGPPEEDYPDFAEVEEVRQLLGDVDESIVEKVCQIVEELAIAKHAEFECSACMARMEQEMAEGFADWDPDGKPMRVVIELGITESRPEQMRVVESDGWFLVQIKRPDHGWIVHKEHKSEKDALIDCASWY